LISAYKNRGIQTLQEGKEWWLFGAVAAMIICLFVSRAALSISTICFLVLAIVRKDFRQQWRRVISTPFLLFFTLLFFIPFVSGLWSENLSKWADVVRLKLPLLFFPLTFAGSWQFTKKQWLLITAIFLTGVTLGSVWSLLHYLQNAAAIHEGYLQAKTLLTPLENDHVRFSWLVSVAAMTCFLVQRFISSQKAKLVLWTLTLFFTVYLHVLAARTGLLSLYIFLLLYAGWFLVKKQSVKTAVLLGAVLLVLPVLAYLIVPTFQNRIRYLVYDFSFVQKAEYLPGANDGARVMSLKAGWQVLQQHPFGAGAGDVMLEAEKWYVANVPDVLPTDKFYPSSEWLLYGAFAGWIGVLLFTAIMLLPFFVRIPQHKIFWIALHATAAFSFAFDMGLEVQYGIFLYAFLTFWWWKWLEDVKRQM
jgi:O-antigen ligase